jgi:hypothetical protein
MPKRRRPTIDRAVNDALTACMDPTPAPHATPCHTTSMGWALADAYPAETPNG